MNRSHFIASVIHSHDLFIEKWSVKQNNHVTAHIVYANVAQNVSKKVFLKHSLYGRIIQIQLLILNGSTHAVLHIT